jgi:hypothetical protein
MTLDRDEAIEILEAIVVGHLEQVLIAVILATQDLRRFHLHRFDVCGKFCFSSEALLPRWLARSGAGVRVRAPLDTDVCG